MFKCLLMSVDETHLEIFFKYLLKKRMKVELSEKLCKTSLKSDTRHLELKY